MLNFLYAQPSEEDEKKLQALLDAIEPKRIDLEGQDTLEKKKGALLGIISALPKGHYEPSQGQLEFILAVLDPKFHAVTERQIYDHVLSKQPAHLKPVVSTALHLSFALGALYFTPELFGLFAFKAVLQKMLSPYLGQKGISGAEIGISLIAYQYGYRFNQITLMDNMLPDTVAQQNFFLRLPFHLAIGGVMNAAVSSGGTALRNIGSGLYNVGSGLYQVGRLFTDLTGITEPNTPYLLGYMHQDSEYAEYNYLDELFDDEAQSQPVLTHFETQRVQDADDAENDVFYDVVSYDEASRTSASIGKGPSVD